MRSRRFRGAQTFFSFLTKKCSTSQQTKIFQNFYFLNCLSIDTLWSCKKKNRKSRQSLSTLKPKVNVSDKSSFLAHSEIEMTFKQTKKCFSTNYSWRSAESINTENSRIDPLELRTGMRIATQTRHKFVVVLKILLILSTFVHTQFPNVNIN